MHALCLRTESEHYRRLKSQDARTMGALYWQLNSIWQAPTWATIEYGNTWKLAHYYTTHFFNTTIISSYVNKNGIYEVYVTSDSMENQNGEYNIKAIKWYDGSVTSEWKGNITINALDSVLIFQEDIDIMLQTTSYNASELVFTLEWIVDEKEIAKNVFYITTISEANLQPTSLTYQINTNTLPYGITIQCSSVSPFTYLETSVKGRFSDNGFLCNPNQPTFLHFMNTTNFSLNEFEDSLVIRSIQETYLQ